MDRALFVFSVVAGLVTAIAVAPAQNYPTRDPNDLLHGGPIENGVKHQPTQAEIDERIAHDKANPQSPTAPEPSTAEVDRLYSQIKQQSQTTTILTPQNTPSPVAPPPKPNH